MKEKQGVSSADKIWASNAAMARNLRYAVFGLAVLVLIAIILISTSHLFKAKSTEKQSDIRLGYMTLWAEGSFSAEVLQNTDIAKKNDVKITPVRFQYGPPMVEAALAKQVDAIVVGWVPAIQLMSKSDDWVIVGKLAYFPMGLMARNGSGISSIEGLKGKKVGVGYATGPYPLVLMSLEEAGLTPGKDVSIINMAPSDMGAALSVKAVDAVAWAEPSITLFEKQGLAYPIKEYSDISFVLFSKSYVREHPEEVRKFLTAFKESQLYISENKKQVFGWFSQESQFDISLIESLRVTEPNFKADSIGDIDISIDQSWIDSTQKKIDFEYREKIIERRVNLSESIDLSYLD